MPAQAAECNASLLSAQQRLQLQTLHRHEAITAQRRLRQQLVESDERWKKAEVDMSAAVEESTECSRKQATCNRKGVTVM